MIRFYLSDGRLGTGNRPGPQGGNVLMDKNGLDKIETELRVLCPWIVSIGRSLPGSLEKEQPRRSVT